MNSSPIAHWRAQPARDSLASDGSSSSPSPSSSVNTSIRLLAVIAVGIALVTAWLGGELVYRLRVGVDADAGLDASSSLARHGPVDVEA